MDRLYVPSEFHGYFFIYKGRCLYGWLMISRQTHDLEVHHNAGKNPLKTHIWEWKYLLDYSQLSNGIEHDCYLLLEGSSAPGRAAVWGAGWSHGASAGGMFPWALCTGVLELARRFCAWAKLIEQETGLSGTLCRGGTSTAADAWVTAFSAPACLRFVRGSETSNPSWISHRTSGWPPSPCGRPYRNDTRVSSKRVI